MRRARLFGGVAPQGLGGCSTDDVHRQQLDQLPPVVLQPVRLDDVPPTTKEADPASYIAGGRGGRLVEQGWSGSIGTMLSSRGFV